VHETDLHLDPNEASDLARVLDAEERARRGWDRAFLTVLDETHAEDALALLCHRAGAPLDDGWEARRLRTTVRPPEAAERTQDAEACAVRRGVVYVLGSQFGKKTGPLSAQRSWIARLSEAALARAADGERVELEVARLRFALHRAVNDALEAAAVEPIALGPRARAAYLDATIARGAAKAKRWAGRVRSGDWPINVEALEFRADGRALLGLRFPVTADGHPILVELADVDALFDDPDAVPAVGGVWVLADVGDRSAPAGVRALDTRGDDRFDAVVGDLDASGKSATVLEDIPEGAVAPSRHVRFALPLAAAGGHVATEEVHHFGDLRRVEGLAIDDEGHAHFVLDEEGQVALRTLLVE
jgi:hypothetical protein